MKVNFRNAVFVCGLFMLAGVSRAEAASLYIDPAMSTLHRGDSVTMSVRLDVDEATGECINAVDGVVTYSDNIEPVDISLGDSIFSIWVEQPKINREARTVTFAGGIPNGYCGRIVGDPRLSNVLAKIIFRSPGFVIGAKSETGNEAVVSFTDESTAYLNDGYGTKAPLMTYGATVTLDPKAGKTLENPWHDQVAADERAPEPFAIELVKGEKEFSGRYYVVFNTTDKETGVDQYQIMEEPLSKFGAFEWGRGDAPWILARSPYVLKDQSLNSIIRVKAIDKAGNEYIANLIPEDSLRTGTFNQTYILIIGAILVGIFLLMIIASLFVRRRKAKKNAQVVQTVSETTEPHESSDQLEHHDDPL